MPITPQSTDALVLMDLQYDFLPGGSLAVADGDAVIPLANRLAQKFQNVVMTQDWHPAQTAHFGTPPNFSTSWPVHCVADTPGAQLHPELVVPAGTWAIHKGMEVLTNGADDTSYSACNGFDAAGVGLAAALRNAGVTHVYLAGLAFDYCVGDTALDLCKAGFAVTVLEDATESIADASRVQVRARLLEVGVVLAASATVA